MLATEEHVEGDKAEPRRRERKVRCTCGRLIVPGRHTCYRAWVESWEESQERFAELEERRAGRPEAPLRSVEEVYATLLEPERSRRGRGGRSRGGRGRGRRAETEEGEPKRQSRRRLFADGVFDLAHSGHLNGLRQVRMLCSYLVVGVNSDSEVEQVKKAAPLLTAAERAYMLSAVRFVDRVVVGTPYEVRNSTLDALGCEAATHGDDDVAAYQEPAAAGRLVTYYRTEGVSSVGMAQRLLKLADALQTGEPLDAPQGTTLASLNRLKQLGDTRRRVAEDKVVYIDGAWDLLTPEHISALIAARLQGTYLIVGVWSDDAVQRATKRQLPMQGLAERAQALLALSMVDDVILGAPLEPTPYLASMFDVAVYYQWQDVLALYDTPRTSQLGLTVVQHTTPDEPAHATNLKTLLKRAQQPNLQQTVQQRLDSQTVNYTQKDKLPFELRVRF